MPKGFLNPVRLTSGEEFSELESFVTLKRSDGENADKQVGLLIYVPEFESKDGLRSESASCQVVCELPARQFDDLVSVTRQGHMPSLISVDVIGEGVETGWEPDGSGFDWNNKEYRRAPIAGISFNLPLVLREGVDEFDEDGAMIAGIARANRKANPEGGFTPE